LDNAASPAPIDLLPALRVRRLSGDLGGLWSMSILGSRQIVFRFRDADPFDADPVDDH